MTDSPIYVFSLGYRCSSAGILKQLGIKTESYPFDWLVSRLPIIEHCVETDFREFLDPSHYEYLHTNTYHYPTPSSEPEWICGEDIHWNRYYQDSLPNTSLRHYVPSFLTRPRDAYAYHLMMNHRNIQKPEDHAYLERCVDRWRTMTKSAQPKVSLYIHPMLTQEELQKDELVEELARFHSSFSRRLQNYQGLYVVPVRSLSTETQTPAIEMIHQTETSQIVILWGNHGMMDAGEIFMGDMSRETNLLCEWLSERL